MEKAETESKNNAKRILERLEQGPARPKELENELHIAHSSVMYTIRDSELATSGVIFQFTDGKNAGKYGVKYALGQSTEEDEIKKSYELQRRKLHRNPTPSELAFLIKKTPSEAKDALFKFIPRYREPTEDEMASSAKTLFKMLIWSSLNLPSKKGFFEKRVTNVVVEGIDQETLDEILEQKPTISLDDAKKYIIEFPEMKPDISQVDESNKVIYKVKWSEEAKSALSAIDTWNDVAEIRIPKRYDDREDKFRFSGGSDYDEYYHAKELAEIYVPSQGIIDRLIEMIGLPHHQCEVLQVLKKFCQNALKVEQLNENNKEKIFLALSDFVFSKYFPDIHDYEKGSDEIKERNIAFDIIEMLDVRTKDGIDIAMGFVNSYLIGPENYEGPDIDKVVKWLAKDPDLRGKLEKKIEDLLKDPPYFMFAGHYRELLQNSLSVNGH